jgi:hypothetical protein
VSTYPRRLVALTMITGLMVAGPGLTRSASAAAATSCTTTHSLIDYNGDGYDDAAVGDPYATVNGKVGAGAVTVLLGGADGRIGSGGRTVITQASFGEVPEAGDHFGYDVVLTQAVLQDLCADLLIGAPGEDLSAGVDAGMAYLVSDLPDAEGAPGLTAFALSQAGAGGKVEAGDQLGASVAVMDLTQEDPRRLVVGAPGEDVGSAADAGVVNVWRLDQFPIGMTELQQGKVPPLGGTRFPGTPQTGDRFGSSLVTGVLDLTERDGLETAQGLVIGAPGDHVAGRAGAGSITVVQEEFESVSLITQATAGVPGTPEVGDRFGFSVALSPQQGSSPRTLAVGSPGEDAGTRRDTGTVTLFSNTAERFVPRTTFSQATANVPGANEAGDGFGHAVAFGLRPATLLVGIPREDVGSVSDAGAVQPVRVPGVGQPLVFLPAITEGAPGTPGTVAAAHQFGRALGALSGTSERIVTISSLYDRGGSVYVLSDSPEGSPRSWSAGAGAGRFGWSVSN